MTPSGTRSQPARQRPRPPADASLQGGAVAGRRPKVALATCRALPDLGPGDEGLVPALREAGLDPSIVAWDESVDWAAFDAVLIRTTWDYSDRVEEFREWIDDLAGFHVAVWNPLKVLRWNLHKDYLRVMGLRGLPVVPTVWVPKGDRLDLDAVMGEQGWSDVVVKPAISAGGRRTVRIRTGVAASPMPRTAPEDLLIQPFVPEVQQNGELSLVFLGGGFSHAVRKRPAPGGFLVQPQHGGTIEAVTPRPETVTLAAHLLQAAPEGWLYGRVDLVETASGPVLMEMEMLEPNLFLPYGPGSAQRLARYLAQKIREAPAGARAEPYGGPW